jgi:hypothetical protein
VREPQNSIDGTAPAIRRVHTQNTQGGLSGWSGSHHDCRFRTASNCLCAIQTALERRGGQHCHTKKHRKFQAQSRPDHGRADASHCRLAARFSLADG